MDDFEAFRKKKLEEKRKVQDESVRKVYYEFEVSEEGKAKGLTTHRQNIKDLEENDIPEVENFKSHIQRSNLPEESIQKFKEKQLWGDNISKVDPGSVKKVKKTSHITETGEVDPDSLEPPKGLKRY